METKKEVKKEKEEKKEEKENKEQANAKKKLEKIKIVRKGHKKEENKFKKFISSYQFLYSVFGVLLVAVIILSILVYKEKHNVKTPKADFVYPVIYKGTQNSMKIDLPELYKKGKYTILITNTHNKKTNKEALDYNIVLKNKSDIDVKVVKAGTDDNLMVDQDSTRIEGQTLSGGKEQEDKYVITIDKKPKSGDELLIEINS